MNIFKQINETRLQIISLTILRIVIGWHFLHEGIYKIMKPSWTSFYYLKDSDGVFKPVFNFIADNQILLNISDYSNIYGLTIVGLFLVLGIYTRFSTIVASIFLLMYYISHPPLIGLKYALPTEGEYMIFDKNFIEMIALWVIFIFPQSKVLGIDFLLCKKFK